MSNLLFALALAGQATYYSDGLMEQVAANRGMDLTGYVGGVALNHPDNLGDQVWLLWPLEGQLTGPHLVVDCAAAQHIAEREARGYVVEVDARTARRIGFYGVGPHPVVVLFERPAWDGPRLWR